MRQIIIRELVLRNFKIHGLKWDLTFNLGTTNKINPYIKTGEILQCCKIATLVWS